MADVKTDEEFVREHHPWPREARVVRKLTRQGVKFQVQRPLITGKLTSLGGWCTTIEGAWKSAAKRLPAG